MGTLRKRTFHLPAELVAEFEKEVPRGQRSATMGRIIRQWIETQEREQLRAEILAGILANREFDAEVEREWAPPSDEVWALRSVGASSRPRMA